MDVNELRKNLAIYKHNIIAINGIDNSVLTFYEKQHMTAIKNRLTTLKNNVETMLGKIEGN